MTTTTIVFIIIIFLVMILPDLLPFLIPPAGKSKEEEMKDGINTEIEYEEKDEFWGDKNGKIVNKNENKKKF